MAHILKKDDGSLVMLLQNGLVKKKVIGRNKSGFKTGISPKDMVDREIRALQMLEGIDGIQKYRGRASDNTFYSEYIKGISIRNHEIGLSQTYFDSLKEIIRQCEHRGIYRLGMNRSDFIIRPDGSPGIVDFGNILFYDDKNATFPGSSIAAKAFRTLRILDLQRRYSSSIATAQIITNH